MKKRNIIMILMISLSLVLLLGSSYAFLSSVQEGDTPYVISIGTLKVSFKDSTDVLTLTDMYPMTDDEGKAQSEELEFTIENTGTVAANYNVSIEETSTESTEPDFKNHIKFISSKDSDNYSEPKTLSTDKYIEKNGHLGKGETATYKVKVWLDAEAGSEYMDKEFKARIVVEGKQENSNSEGVN